MTKDTGGPAFPFSYEEGGKLLSCNGMTLRDWFAGQALVGILSGELSIGVMNSDSRAALLSQATYEIADAMLAERSKP